MSPTNDYPKINITSKNVLAKRIASSTYPFNKALSDINYVIENFDKLWKDSAQSKPDKGKFVRSAYGNKLGKLLNQIDKRILAKYDFMFPPFVFGGVSKKNHILAGRYLVGTRRKRTLLALDITKFFEQISYERVYYFFHKKAGCSAKASRLLAKLCCVSEGPKNNPSGKLVLARGFATSQRLAVWCNLTTFIKANRLIHKRLKNHDPRLAVYVDDIGIMASRVPENAIEDLKLEVIELLQRSDKNQPLPVNNTKTKISGYLENQEHLGMRIRGKSLSFGKKTTHRRARLINQLKKEKDQDAKKRLVLRKRSYGVYSRQLKNS